MNVHCRMMPARLRRLSLFFTVITACAPAFSEAAEKRWNILFVFADDWGRYASCYKGLDGRPTLNDVVTTPHVDRLAREGVLFRNAFVNSPSCTPCRSSLMSGRYFFNCGRGAILNGAEWDPAIPSFPLVLRDAGYHIGKSYKVWSPGTPGDAPFGQQQHAYEKAGRAPNNFSEEATARIAKGMSLEAARDDILSQVRGNFDAFLADRKDGKPWLYFFGTTTTHRKWIKGSGKKLWDIEPDDLKGKMPKFLPDVPEVREDVADYLGECQAVDAQLGVLLKRLDEIGETENTLVIASGDHGMPGVPSGKCNLYDHGVHVALVARVPGGRGGRIVDDFVRLPDLAPTLMEAGGATPPAGLYGRSLLPVLKSDKSGQVDPERTWVITGRERHVASAREGNLPYPMRSLRMKDFVYIRNFKPDRTPMGDAKGVTEISEPDREELTENTYAAFPDMDSSPTKSWVIQHRNDSQWKWVYDLSFGKRPAEELYDIRADPDMTINLAAEPAHAETKSKMSAQLLKLLQEANDPRLADDVIFEKPPFTDAGEPKGKKGKGKKEAGA